MSVERDMLEALRVMIKQRETAVVANRAAKNFFRGAQVFARERSWAPEHGAIYPSSLCTCMRRSGMDLYPDLPRFPEDKPENVRRAGVVGDILHDLIQSSFERAARKSGTFDFQREVRIDEKTGDLARSLLLRGRGDGEFRFEDRRIGLEIKSVGAEVFSTLREPPEDHLLQVAPYQELLGWDAVWFVYVSRRTFVDRPFVLRIPDKYWKTMFERATCVIEHHLRDLLPPGTTRGSPCKWCVYERICPHPRTRAIPIADIHTRVRALTESREPTR